MAGPQAVVIELSRVARHTPYLLTAIISSYTDVFVLKGSAYAVTQFLFRVRGRSQFRLSFVRTAPVGVDGFFENARQKVGEGRSFTVNHDYFGHRKPDDLFMPYYLHPNMYSSGLYAEAQARRQRDRKISISFGGSVNEAYRRVAAYSVMSRNDVLGIVERNFPDNCLFVDGKEDLTDAVSGGRKRIVLSVTLDTRNTLSKHKLDQREFWDLVASSDFALCPPGLVPHSHNLIEALAVGTIPILNYAHLFKPQLQDGVTCLVFSNPESLLAAINRALEMKPDEIARMRRNVVDLYDNYLEPSAWIRNIRANSPAVAHDLFVIDSTRVKPPA